MAGSSLLTLIDDIASILDDVFTMTKVAAKKTSGVLGDDLALNAKQVSGVLANRELPVVWAVAKGSMVNKAILVPTALAISAIVPWAVTPLLMIGGAYLCFEGFEKLVHTFGHRGAAQQMKHKVHVEALADPTIDPVALEKEKIRGAIRTDFILSAEIIVIALGTVAAESLAMRVGVLVAIAALMTLGVYGLVAGIVKLDDLGYYLAQKKGLPGGLGRLILNLAPYLMRTLSIVGTAAMFLVGGGILVHGIPGLRDVSHHLEDAGRVVGTLGPPLASGVVGLVAGAVLVGLVTLLGKLKKSRPAAGRADLPCD
jgi:predicted DNA repair protein MutK